MTIGIDAIITLGAVISALIVIIGVILKTHSFYLEQGELAKEIAVIKDEQRETKDEQRVIIEALLSIHDGLEQLGCNHTVPEGKRRLEKHLNERAHK